MKGRLVDTLLIITLVLVAFGITYTLLTLNRSQTRSPARPAASEAPAVLPIVPESLAGSPVGNSTGVTPLVPGAVNPLAPATPADTAAPALPEITADEPTVVEADLPVEPDVPVLPPRTLAAGEVPLERVGFSWVTGGAGACGMILEPWEHVAVSRELLADLGCGAAVTVHLDEPVAGRSSIDAIIGDTMNPTHSFTVNIYVDEDEPALQYGVAAGSLEAR